MALLETIGVLLIIAWLVLWLWIKITFAAIHLLLVVGVIVLVVSLLKRIRRI